MKKIFIIPFILLLSFTFSLNIAFAEKVGPKVEFKKLGNPVSEIEPNDSLDQANLIQPLDEVQGIMEDNSDNDYFKLDMPNKGQFNLTSYWGEYARSSDLTVTILDNSGNQIITSTYEEDYNYDNEHTGLQKISISLDKGTYYLLVKTTGTLPTVNDSYILKHEIVYQPDFTITGLTSNYVSPQIERRTITFQANASKVGLQYQFSVQNKIVKVFSSENTFQWIPTVTGTQKIKVEVRDPANPSAVAVKEIPYTILAYKPDFAITSFAPNIKSPYLTGKTINLWAKTNRSGLQYQFSVNGKVVQSFGAKTYYSWKPTRSGRYNLKVEVRRSQYPNRIVTKQLSYDITDGKVYVTSLKANMSSPRPTSTNIKWSASGKGVNLEYQFSVYQNKKWKTIKSYSTKNYVYWKPKSAASYKVKVSVRSKLSKKTATKTVSYSIFKPSYFSTPSLKSDISTTQAAGKYFYFTSKSSGKYLEYRFRIYNGYSWYTIQNYSSSKSVYWYAGYEGNYKIAVDVRQKGTNKIKTKKLSLDIREAPYNEMSYNYNYYYNYGSMTFKNYGYNNIKVTKISFTNNGKSYYSYKPKNWITYGRTYQTYYFYPDSQLYDFSWNTVVKVYYTFDGMSYVANMYRTY